MKRSWKSLAKQFNQLKLSERRLVTITSLVLVFVSFAMLVWEPMMLKWGERTQALLKIQNSIAEVDQNIETLILKSEFDPNEALRNELQALIAKVKDQQAEISSITSALITPEKMTTVFKELLSNRQLKLNSMLNAKATGVTIPDQSSDTTLLFEHGLSLEMEGSYMAVLNYIRHLESQNWKLYWDELIYTTTQYPKGTLQLKVHTVSTSGHVLGI